MGGAASCSLFDVLQNSTQSFVVRDGGVGNALIHVEDFVGQGAAFERTSNRPSTKGVGVHVFADQAARDVVLFEHDPLAIIGERQLLADIPVLAPAQHIRQPIRLDIEMRGAGCPAWPEPWRTWRCGVL